MELKNLVIFGLKIRLYAIEIATMNQYADNCLSEQKKMTGITRVCLALKDRNSETLSTILFKLTNSILRNKTFYSFS